MTKIALVTGATGVVGPRVVEALRCAGLSVRILARSEPAPDLFRVPPEAFFGDIRDPEAVNQAVEGVATVVHLAALLHATGTWEPGVERYQDVNVAGTRCLLEASKRASVDRFVLASTISVYGETEGFVADEASPLRPVTPYAQSKSEAERLVLDAHADQQLLGVVLRMAAVYGPRMKGNYDRLVRAIAARRFYPLGPGENRRTLVHEADAASAFALAATHPGSPGEVWNVTDGQIHPLKEVIAAIYRSLGRRVPRGYIPGVATRIMLALLGKAAEDSTLSKLAAKLRKYSEDVAVDGSKLRARLGFAPRIGLAAGWNQSVPELLRGGPRPSR